MTKLPPNQLVTEQEPEVTPNIMIKSNNLVAELRVNQLRQQWLFIIRALNKVANSKVPLSGVFRAGQKVWLKAKNLALLYRSAKLAPQCYSLFTIEGEVAPVIYKLTLPSQWNIYPIFYASLLTPYIKTKEYSENFLRLPPDLVRGKE
jgi:hypothetical protein